MDDELLLKRCQKGDLDAFDSLIEMYQQKVYNIAYRMMGNYHDASDVSQEVFVRVYKSLKNFRGDCAFSTWLYHIATNVCKDELRSKKRYNEESIDEYINTEKGQMAKEIAADSPTPEEEYERAELSARLQTVIDTLHPDYRAVIILREQNSLSYQEIAEVLDISLGTVKSRINRARAILAKKIAANPKLFPEYIRLYGKAEGNEEQFGSNAEEKDDNIASFPQTDDVSKYAEGRNA